jgi:uncharacterized protein DUF6265
VIAMAMMAAAAAASSEPLPDLGWMSGYWLSCANGQEVSETWSASNGHSLRGSSMTVDADGRTTFEVMHIATSKGQLTYFAEPRGQAPAEFPLKSASETEAVFENPKHDFPQRIIYRREGDQLLARIEGQMGEEVRAVDWSYSAAPLNSSCPKQPAAGETPAAPEGASAESPPEPRKNAEAPATAPADAANPPTKSQNTPAEPDADAPPKTHTGPVGPPEYEATPLPPI